MKFANVNGIKVEAEKGLIGYCQGCEQPMIPVCGIKKAKHWRHKVDCECDHWWENETEWHRGWKNHFPIECQEIRHKDAATGEWHIVDVNTKQNHFLEFQHSYLKPEERQARNKFYGANLVWVVDGLARKNDWRKMEPILNGAREIYRNISLFRLPSNVGEISVLNDWNDCKVPVFFDFGVDNPMCCLLPKSSKGSFYMVRFSRQDFITLHNGELLGEKNFSELMLFLSMRVFAFENPDLMAAMQKVSTQAQVQAQEIKHPVVQKPRVFVPLISQRELNYLLRVPTPRRRQGRRL